MYGGHFNDYISSFLTRSHNPRAQFEDTKEEEIDHWEDVDEKYEGELSGVNCKEEIIDIKDNPIIIDETGDNEYRDGCASLSLMKDVTYCCEQCDYTTEVLYRHRWDKHDGVKYSCDQCDYSASNKRNLKQHRESKHDGVKYSCDQCDYSS